MSKQVKPANQWWEKRPILALVGFLNFLLAYGFGSVAIDTGRYWFYLATVVSGIAGIWSLARAIRKRKI